MTADRSILDRWNAAARILEDRNPIALQALLEVAELAVVNSERETEAAAGVPVEKRTPYPWKAA